MPNANHDSSTFRVESVSKYVGASAKCRKYFPTTAFVIHLASDFREAFKALSSGLDTNDGVSCGNPVLANQEFVQALDIL